MQRWVDESSKWANDGVPILLVATKSDREEKREVTTREGQELASSLGLQFIETSAKLGTNVDEAFQVLLRSIVQNHEYELNLFFSSLFFFLNMYFCLFVSNQHVQKKQWTSSTS